MTYKIMKKHWTDLLDVEFPDPPIIDEKVRLETMKHAQKNWRWEYGACYRKSLDTKRT